MCLCEGMINMTSQFCHCSMACSFMRCDSFSSGKHGMFRPASLKWLYFCCASPIICHFGSRVSFLSTWILLFYSMWTISPGKLTLALLTGYSASADRNRMFVTCHYRPLVMNWKSMEISANFLLPWIAVNLSRLGCIRRWHHQINILLNCFEYTNTLI